MKTPLSEKLQEAIEKNGPISIAKFMAASNAHYYATRDPLGAHGDFITAPEISQMFGELIGLWIADLWLRAGRQNAYYVELGPGRGTLALDALRSMATVGFEPPVHFVETSPVLREKQQAAHPNATFHDHIGTLPTDGPLLIVANEFFDALPIHQVIRADDCWRQRSVGWRNGKFLPTGGIAVPNNVIPEHLLDSGLGSIIETSPDAVDIVRQLSQRLGEQGGAAVIIDYGYDGPAIGDTLQALSAHGFVPPLSDPGEIDMTAHVDFHTLGAMAELCGIAVYGAIDQGEWLARLGLAERAAALAETQPQRLGDIESAVRRLSAPEAMGRLFRVMGLTAADWPKPAGFD